MILLRRLGKPWLTCLFEALKRSSGSFANSPPPRARIWTTNNSRSRDSPGLKNRLTRLVPCRLRSTTAHRSQTRTPEYTPFAVDIQNMGSQYRATSGLRSPASRDPVMMPFPTYESPLRSPRPAHVRPSNNGSVTDLPSYGDANRDAPPRYDGNGTHNRPGPAQEEILVENNFVS